MPRYATLVAALTTWTGTLTARPSGSVMAPEIVPTEDCCAVRFAATRTKRGSHLMYGLYMPTPVLEVRRVGIAKARLPGSGCKIVGEVGTMEIPVQYVCWREAAAGSSLSSARAGGFPRRVVHGFLAYR